LQSFRKYGLDLTMTLSKKVLTLDSENLAKHLYVQI
jgi:hypothetical protein